MLDSFFLSGADRPALLWSQHDPQLVALSLVLAVLSSVMALHMATLAQTAQGQRVQQTALLTGAVALGAGIWGMHFIGMLAFSVCGHGKFNAGLTLLSVLS